MQLVIDISEKNFKRLEQFGFIPDLWVGVYENTILNGTPLPEHHGRLIDADAYIGKHEECGWLDDITVDEFNKITPTIIPATKEGGRD